MADREPGSPGKPGTSSRGGKSKSPLGKKSSKPRKGTSGRPSSKKPPGRKAAPRPVAVGRRKRADTSPGRTRRLLGLLCSLCAFLLALDLLVLWAPITEHMDATGYDRPAAIHATSAQLAVGVPATQAAWRSLWLQAGYLERGPDGITGPRQFSMSPGQWQVHPAEGDLLLITTRERKVTELIRASDNGPVPGWEFPMPPLGLLSDSTSLESIDVRTEDLPPNLVKAIVAEHDPAFFEHRGLDVIGLLRSKVRSFTQSNSRSTSPTLTRQVANSMFARADDSWQRRGQEVLIALLLEYRYSKEEILESWIRDCHFVSEDGGVEPGIVTAAHRRFGSDLAALNETEIKLLAAGIRPYRGASTIGTPKAPRAASPRSKIPWALDDLRQQLQRRLPDESLHRDGLSLRTTLHPVLQEAAVQSIKESLAELRASHPKWWGTRAQPQISLLAMDPRNGAIRAMASTLAWQEGVPNPATKRAGTAGSAFTPIVLAAAIGAEWPRLGPLSEVLDEPISIPGSGLSNTHNEDGRFLGRVSLRTATERSRRPPFVRLGMSIGPKRLVETARALGVQTTLQPSLSLSLGEQSLTLLDLCTAYATIANAGTRPLPRLLDGLRGPEGTWLDRRMPDSQGVIDPRVASVVTTLLEGVIERGNAHRVRELGFRLPVAGSTGLSSDKRDAWMIGFTPDLVVALWIGTDGSRSLTKATEDLAVGPWTRFMLEAEPFLEGSEFRQPPGSEIAGSPEQSRDGTNLRRNVLRDEDRARRLEEQRALQLMEHGAL